MLKQKKTALLVGTASALLASFSLHAGGMGQTGKFFLIEGGASYLHSFYKTSVIGAESVTSLQPTGRTYNPSNIYPNDFAGGYMSTSFFFNSLLLNARYELFAKKGKVFVDDDSNVFTHMAPAKFAVTLDKVWEANPSLLYGLGAGVVASTNNEAELLFNYLPVDPDIRIGYSFPGRLRLDPVIEAVAMYKLTDKFNARLNVSYQIPAQSLYTNGNLGVNLGINYAMPV